MERFQALYPAMKRGMDIIVSGTALLLVTPLLLVLFALVRVTSRGPAVFWSARTGYQGESFMMPKLRTMTQCSKVMSREDAVMSDVSVTRLGHILRKTSLDELPQLWCVLRGDMSLIGPRPAFGQ